MKRNGPFLRGRYNVSTMICILLTSSGLRCRIKNRIVEFGFMNVGAQCVHMRPESDNQQLTQHNPMCILIFYIFSRFSELWAGRLQRLSFERYHPSRAAVAGAL